VPLNKGWDRLAGDPKKTRSGENCKGATLSSTGSGFTTFYSIEEQTIGSKASADF
jgi:hypothetical protein